MHRYNFPGRVKVRREQALERRAADLDYWRNAMRGASEYTARHMSAKVSAAQSEIARLDAKLHRLTKE